VEDMGDRIDVVPGTTSDGRPGVMIAMSQSAFVTLNGEPRSGGILHPAQARYVAYMLLCWAEYIENGPAILRPGSSWPQTGPMLRPTETP
jgi:hypothetical protein